MSATKIKKKPEIDADVADRLMDGLPLGQLSARLECMITEGMSEAIDVRAMQLQAGGRSRAARDLMERGIRDWLAEQA